MRPYLLFGIFPDFCAYHLSFINNFRHVFTKRKPKLYFLPNLMQFHMNAEEFSRMILNIDGSIRFSGIVEKSGHLYASVMREGLDEHLKGRDPEISFSQSAYIVDLRKMFTQELGNLDFVIYIYEKVRMISMPLKDQVLVLSADISGDLDDLLSKLKRSVKEIEPGLELRKVSTPLDREKLEILRNLFESGISEEMIADQLDLDVDTVKLAIREMSKAPN